MAGRLVNLGSVTVNILLHKTNGRQPRIVPEVVKEMEYVNKFHIPLSCVGQLLLRSIDASPKAFEWD